jgi:rhodanese-related sulfurtransferase
LGHLDGAVVLPLPALAGRRSALVPYRGQPLVTVGKTEGRLVRAAQLLREHHLPTVSVRAGGMEAWHQAGLPVASQRTTPADPEAHRAVGASGDPDSP